ncbi:MAG: CPBP family intramembrane glutamic endopeptidase [Thermoplasmatota archaeon]
MDNPAPTPEGAGASTGADAGPRDAPVREIPFAAQIVIPVLALLAMIVAATEALGFSDQGQPYTGATWAIVGGAYAGCMLAVAVVPARFNRWLHRRGLRGIDAGPRVAALLVVMTALFLVFGLGSAVVGVNEWESTTHGQSATGGNLTQNDILLSVGINVILLVLPAVVWLHAFYGLKLVEIPAALGVRKQGFVVSALLGAALALGGLMVLAVVGAASQVTGHPLPENQQALGISCALTPASALIVAVLAAVTEEVFFRGFLQPAVGIIGQAVLFSIAHVSYFNVVELAVTLGLGLAFGWAKQATGSLTPSLVAHFLFNGLVFLTVLTGGGC